MTLIQTTKPPINLEDYVKIPEAFDEEALQDELRRLIRQAVFNIHLPEAFIATVVALEQDITANKYRVYVIPKTSAVGEFFFEKY